MFLPIEGSSGCGGQSSKNPPLLPPGQPGGILSEFSLPCAPVTNGLINWRS